MEPRGPARAAVLGPLLLLPLLLPQSGPAVSAQSAASACSQSSNRTCAECLRNVSCFWCKANNACLDYPVRKILPPRALCPLSSARWGVCWAGGQVRRRENLVEIFQTVLGTWLVWGIKAVTLNQKGRPEESFTFPILVSTVNFEALIIAMSVVGGSLLLGITICCCCCCRKRKDRRSDEEEERAAREREERKVRQEERRAEMKSRHEEIRKKYGLFKEQNPYARFEN
ncbi:pituitary tumor-transforming gene 1 protein-interacting protein isoform X1 [Petaurus breviceps papuanus]|uniref:pituitary tumor-transforming gene 1 protein-interacting protein isoform X1 n=1 Tax=Petaurus breviceps papuanus TaxID=3040969 RepID=UPI0036DC60D7